MTEQEIVNEQRNSGDERVYLQLVGTFYHAYDTGAFALARLTGYKVKRRKRRTGELLVAGFPAQSLPRVKERIAAAGVSMENVKEGDNSTFILTGADTTPDTTLIVPDASASPSDSSDNDSQLAQLKDLRRELLGINICELSPQEIVLALRNLQIKCLAHMSL